MQASGHTHVHPNAFYVECSSTCIILVASGWPTTIYILLFTCINFKVGCSYTNRKIYIM